VDKQWRKTLQVEGVVVRVVYYRGGIFTYLRRSEAFICYEYRRDLCT